jgi:hypothetical protein
MADFERKTFRLSARYSVEIAVSSGGIDCTWDPDLPERLTADEMDAYTKALAEIGGGLAELTCAIIVCAGVNL